ncbi:MAG TPA: DUF1592 domain-containing protein [Polyangiaceae bacterium]
MSSRTYALLLSLGLAGLGCQARIEGGTPGGGDALIPTAPGGSGRVEPGAMAPPEEVLGSSACQKPTPGAAPLRRLSNAEYRNTVRDLLAQAAGVEGAVAAATKDFVDEAESLGFRNNTDFLGVSSLIAQGYMDAAEALAPLTASTPGLVGCTSADAACARQFIESFGKRAFRRPVSADEKARYQALYDKALAAGYTFETGIEWIAFSMLQSTEFLYRVELGTLRGSDHVPSQYETASRLSYLIWQSMPDQALLDAAAAGQLGTKQEIASQAQRLMQDSKSSRLLEYFDQWLDVDRLVSFDRDQNVYPSLDPNLPTLLRQETHAFIGDLLKSPQGSLTELLTGQYSFLNADLAKHYGVTGPSGSELVRVDLPGRAGVLTQGMLLAHDKPTRTSIVRRGLKVRLDLFCQNVPAPPNDVQLDLEGLGEGLTQRERLEKHRSVASCAGCHNLMDPLGVAFEGFDAVGRARTVDELGKPVDVSTEISLTVDADGPLSGAAELGQRLAQSQAVRDCYVTQSFRFFYGRDYSEADKCSMAQLSLAFQQGKQSLSGLIVALAQTDHFLYRPAPEAQP